MKTNTLHQILPEVKEPQKKETSCMYGTEDHKNSQIRNNFDFLGVDGKITLNWTSKKGVKQ